MTEKKPSKHLYWPIYPRVYFITSPINYSISLKWLNPSKYGISGKKLNKLYAKTYHYQTSPFISQTIKGNHCFQIVTMASTLTAR